MDRTVLLTSDILKLIPHRYPILLVDKITDIEIGIRCKGIKNVTINEPFFQGHFPGNPIMPGVLIVEAMAQTASSLVCHSMSKINKNMSVYFMSISSARFRKPVLPGDTLEMHLEKMQNRNKVWKFKGIAKVDNVVHAEATFTAMVTDKEV